MKWTASENEEVGENCQLIKLQDGLHKSITD